ncbi:MAG: PilN domain-containing protein [Patescibacteria group bacterium]|nr:PilN domain-containing protein [Patescibacteria group bacterium]
MSINLAPSQTLEESPFWSKFIHWSTNVGRLVIIATQIAVLAAFFARFLLDRQIINQNEEIKTKKTVILTTQSLENKFKQTQDQLSAIKQIHQNKNYYSAILEELTGKIPPEVSFTRIATSEETLQIKGTSTTPRNFAHFLTMLATSENLKSLALEQARINASGSLDFGLSINLAPEAYQRNKST